MKTQLTLAFDELKRAKRLTKKALNRYNRTKSNDDYALWQGAIMRENIAALTYERLTGK